MSGQWLERKPDQSPGLQRLELIKATIAKKRLEERLIEKDKLRYKRQNKELRQ